MRRFGSALQLSLLVLAVLTTAAEAAPVVRAEVIPRQAVVGSPMRLRVTVLVPTWFTSSPDYPSFELAGLVVREPADGSYNVRERIGGVAHVGIVRDYLLYPLTAASYVIDDQVVHVHYAHPETRKPVHLARTLAPIRFDAIVPAAAAALEPFLATRRLSLEQSIEGDLAAPAVGDAITRTVTVTVADLPSMFVPPLIDDRPPAGLRAYARSPETEDVAGSAVGRSIGRRTETVSYLIEEPGDFVLPALKLRWWNRRTGTIEVAEAPALSFVVATPPVAESEGPPRPVLRRGVAILVVLGFAFAIAFVFAGRHRLQRLLDDWEHARARKANSEAVRYRELVHAVRRNEARLIYRQLGRWLDTVGSGESGLSSLQRLPGGEALVRSVGALERASYAGEPYSFDRSDRAALRAALGTTRRELAMTRKSAGSGALPALNPGGRDRAPASG